jgi:hypothetical protein
MQLEMGSRPAGTYCHHVVLRITGAAPTAEPRDECSGGVIGQVSPKYMRQQRGVDRLGQVGVEARF